mmetsp:Transcript_63232/g.137524  ORF Transcript_63232/g.137524 Transcript_63232/m.137524 type:complete len:304 (+) Transcript_63232:793-1704(+)
MNCICAFRTRQGLRRISSVGSGFSGSFFSSSPSASSFSLFSSGAESAPLFAASVAFSSSVFATSLEPEPKTTEATVCSSTSIIISLPRSLAATDSVAMEPTTVVPGVAATETTSTPFAEAPSATELLREALSSMSASAKEAEAFFISLSFSFFSFNALALAAVESTAVAAFACSSFLGGCNGSGYAKSDGLAPDLHEKFLGIFSFSVRPMSAFGVKVKENMWIKGNQYHICVKRQKPIAAPRRSTPDLEKSEAQELRPPASMMPLARIAPNRVIMSSCLSLMTFCKVSRNSFTRSVLPGEVCI